MLIVHFAVLSDSHRWSMIVGDPGMGKSQLAISIAATVTTGGTFPDGEKCEPGNVVMLSAEDDAADTIKPRLEAAGAATAEDGAECPTGPRAGGFHPAGGMWGFGQGGLGAGGNRLLPGQPEAGGRARRQIRNPLLPSRPSFQ